MKRFIKYNILLCSVYSVFLCTLFGCSTNNLYQNIPFELKSREGLSNFFKKAITGETIRVAYMGGSITKQKGWRVYSLNWMKKHFPNVTFSEINAAIGGTAFDLGVFILEEQVLKFDPDLLFIEFAVNDSKITSERTLRSMEGIVRQTWKHNPYTDICFVYAIKQDYLETKQSGQLPSSLMIMEKIADKYHIPSINFGMEVGHLLKERTLIFKGRERDQNGALTFSPDGVHLYPETGHRVYQEVLERSFEKMMKSKKENMEKHSLTTPLTPDNYSNAHMVGVNINMLSGSWVFLDTKNQPGISCFANFLPAVAKTGKTGETLTVNFKGTAIGVYDLIGPNAARVIMEVDGMVTDTISRFDQYCTYTRMNYFLIDNLQNTEHRVVFKVLADPFDKASILGKRRNIIKNSDDYKEYYWQVAKILYNGSILP